MADEQKPTHFFTDRDIQDMIRAQYEIQTNLAVTVTNFNWIIENYKKQCGELTTLRTELDNLKKDVSGLNATMWKHIGIGMGLLAGAELMLMGLPILISKIGGS